MNTDKNDKKTVLIVDDDPFLQGLFRKTLEQEGFKTISALDGGTAVEMLPGLSADLIVLDLMLPKLHGLKVLEAIRAESRHKDLPVLILSNAYLPEIARKAMKAGATRGMSKAECSPARLVEVIRDLLGIRTPNADGDEGPAAKRTFTSWLRGSKPETPGQAGGRNAKAAETAAVAGVKTLLIKGSDEDVSAIRQHCLGYVKAVGTQEATKHLDELYRSLRALGARAAMGGCFKISQLTDAFHAMLFEYVFQHKGETSPSMVQTMAQAVDCLEHLFKTGAAVSSKPSRKPRVLLVDDNPVCNMACETALRRADVETSSATDGAAALALLEISSFDLILLDINMPGLDGFEVCEKIRALPQYRETPVIFVTLNSDFRNRAQSVLSGANGLIAKPISPLELIVKVMVFLLRSAEQKTPANSPATAGLAQPDMAGAAPHTAGNVPAAKETLNTAAGASAPADLENASKPVTPVPVPVTGADPARAEPSVNDTPAHTGETTGHCASAVGQTQGLAQSPRSVLSRRTPPHTGTQELVTSSGAPELETAVATGGQAKSRAALAKQAKQPKPRDVQTKEVEAPQAALEQTVKALTQALAVETERRAAFERQVAEISQRRNALEAELAASNQTQAQVRRELEEAQKQLQAQKDNHTAEPSKLEARAKELEAAQAAVAELKAQQVTAQQQMQTLTGSLKTELGRRETAEKQAAELAARRAELERDLAQRAQTEDKLRAELAAQQERLAAQAKSRQTEQAGLAARTKELEAAHAAVAEAGAPHPSVTKQAQTLTGSLAGELGRREAAEKQAAELGTRRAELDRQFESLSQSLARTLAHLAQAIPSPAGDAAPAPAPLAGGGEAPALKE